MSSSTTIKAALEKWAETSDRKPSEAEEIKLMALYPPIDKMDSTLSELTSCVTLSLSTNGIYQISNLNGLRNLRILSLGRNKIKSVSGLEVIGDTLEELWISCNLIEKLQGIGALTNLKVLYMSNNLVKEWDEFEKLAILPCLEDLLFVGNPLEETHSQAGDWRDQATTKLPKLRKLDGVPVALNGEAI